jgi:hypothetical protein
LETPVLSSRAPQHCVMTTNTVEDAFYGVHNLSISRAIRARSM